MGLTTLLRQPWEGPRQGGCSSHPWCGLSATIYPCDPLGLGRWTVERQMASAMGLGVTHQGIYLGYYHPASFSLSSFLGAKMKFITTQQGESATCWLRGYCFIKQHYKAELYSKASCFTIRNSNICPEVSKGCTTMQNGKFSSVWFQGPLAREGFLSIQVTLA